MAKQAQAQEQRQEAMTSQESMQLVSALLRVACYHLTYLRGLFPDENFKAVEMRNLDNMNIKMLMGKDEEAQRLVHWLDGGVNDALERRYLKKLFFGISKDPEGKDLLEEYVFSFSYDEDGGVHMATGGSSKQRSFGAKGPTLEAVKYQVVRLMRMLVEITNTLEKITYTEDTPDEYEPPMFGPAADGGVGCFSRMPFVMEVGKVDAKHIKVGLAVKTILDNVEDGWEEGDVPVADDNSALMLADETAAGEATTRAPSAPSRPAASDAGGFSCMGGGSRAGGHSGEVSHRQQAKLEDMGEESSGQAPAPGAPLTKAQQRELGSVRSWLLTRPQDEVHVIDCLARFAAISTEAIEAYVQVLQAEGLLVPTTQDDCWQVMKSHKQASASAPRNQGAAEEAVMTAAMQRLAVAPADSLHGGMHNVPGSECTVSRAAPKRKGAEPASDPEDEVEAAAQLGFLDATQASGLQRGRGKASYVRDPIDQTAKRRRVAAKPAAAAPAPAAPVRRSSRPRK
ncbi:homologous pairing [Chlorella sorokiniana]|uniref:Homologous pairing n=1 Tax=Chlorella sorokiniana TaxID=3076 RepID=A0A2P6U130_CHLSO|nr:homologous pairing [Chlorella sorokiniana]|eukprot:PRW60008.1 homologous pairing [Chlorella sorokiniana]